MRTLYAYIRSHFAEGFKPWYYLTVLGFIGICIFNNYAAAPEGYRSWESWIILNFYGKNTALCIAAYLLFYGLPYFSIAMITALFYKDAQFFKAKDFWIRAIFILILISLQASFAPHRLLVGNYSTVSDQYFLVKILAPLNPYLMIGVPVLIFWWWRDRQRGVPFMYGLTRKGFDPLPYFILLGIMLPVIAFAATQPQFLSYYPTLRPAQLKYLTIMEHPWMAVVLYEIVYGLYFIWAEIIFRGFLTVGMSDSMDRHAVAPMSGLYAFRHFAKPPGEAVSSVFGGYILGIIALRSRNIIGGAIIHGGIAVMMDVFALAMSYKL